MKDIPLLHTLPTPFPVDNCGGVHEWDDLSTTSPAPMRLGTGHRMFILAGASVAPNVRPPQQCRRFVICFSDALETLGKRVRKTRDISRISSLGTIVFLALSSVACDVEPESAEIDSLLVNIDDDEEIAEIDPLLTDADEFADMIERLREAGFSEHELEVWTEVVRVDGDTGVALGASRETAGRPVHDEPSVNALNHGTGNISAHGSVRTYDCSRRDEEPIDTDDFDPSVFPMETAPKHSVRIVRVTDDAVPTASNDLVSPVCHQPPKSEPSESKRR